MEIISTTYSAQFIHQLSHEQWDGRADCYNSLLAVRPICWLVFSPVRPSVCQSAQSSWVHDKSSYRCAGAFGPHFVVRAVNSRNHQVLFCVCVCVCWPKKGNCFFPLRTITILVLDSSIFQRAMARRTERENDQSLSPPPLIMKPTTSKRKRRRWGRQFFCKKQEKKSTGGGGQNEFCANARLERSQLSEQKIERISRAEAREMNLFT